jgi:hypothetical protein
MESCASCPFIGTKKGEVLMNGEPIESLSLPAILDMSMVLEDLATPPTAISGLRIVASFFFLSFS